MKNLIKLVTCSLIFILTTSYNDVYPEPIYYEIDFNDGVTHLWSRKVMYNYDNDVIEITKRVDLKYNDMCPKEIHQRAAYQSYIDWEKVFKFDEYVNYDIK